MMYNYTLAFTMQVLSTTVANAFDYFDDEPTTETRKFVLDKFFDCCNTRCISEWYKKNKPNLKPYYTSTDERLEVCILNFRINAHVCLIVVAREVIPWLFR